MKVQQVCVASVKLRNRSVFRPRVCVVKTSQIPATTGNGTIITRWDSRIFRTFHGTIGVMVPLNASGKVIRAGKSTYIGGDRTGRSAEDWKLWMFR